MEIAVLNIQGEETGEKINLSDEIFAIEPNDHCIYLDIKQIRANGRQGTHKTKERGEIVGSTRKLKKQKGTGTARAGSIKSPLFRGGGTIFGPSPRNYLSKINKKEKQLARKSALAYKAKDGAIRVVEDFQFDTPKTKSFVEMMSHLDVTNKKLLFVLDNNADTKNIYLSARNIQNASVKAPQDISTYDVLLADQVVFGVKAVEALQDTLLKK